MSQTRRRNVLCATRMTAQEAATVRQAARQAQVSVAGFIRCCVLAAAGPPR